MKKRHKNKNTREINLKETSLLHDAIALNSQPPWKLESAIILSLLHPIPFQVIASPNKLVKLCHYTQLH